MAFLVDISGSDVPGGSSNASDVGSPLQPDSSGLVISNFVEGEGGLLAVAYGEHLVAGHLVVHLYDVGPPPSSIFTVALGDGQGQRWDSVVKAWFAREELSASPDGATAGYHFHPGTISTGIADALQGVDSFLPGGLAYSGVAVMNVKLPDHLAVEDRPDKLVGRYRCLWTMDYNSNGGEIGSSYSTNPARVAADRIRRYYEQRYFNDLTLAYEKFRNRINWATWANWRDVCDELIEWNDGTTVRNIKRFEYHGAFTEDAALADILDDICGNCCSIWQDDGELINFLTPFDFVPVHNFDLSNIKEGSFSIAPRDIREIPNVITGKFRNLDDEKLTPASVEVKREDLIQRIGKVASTRNLANMTHSQAQRVLLRQLRLEAGIQGKGTPLTCSLRGDASSLHVLPGDYVTITHPVANWTYQLCLVLAASPDAAEDSPDETDFTVQRIDSALYYDTDHAPIQAALSPVEFLPSALADLVFWYEARNPGASYADGDPVTGMDDLGPNVYHLTSLAHTYRANSGAPYLELRSTASYNGGFNIASVLDLAQPGEMSAFFITRYITSGTGTAASALLGTTLSLDNTVRILNPFSGDGKLYLTVGDHDGGGQSTPPSTIGQTFDEIFHLWEFHRNGTTCEVFIDGTPVASMSAFTTTTLANAGAERCIVFGSSNPTFPGGRADHKAGVLYRRYLNSTERAQVRGYLSPIV
jgi:hypothetical protein